MFALTYLIYIIFWETLVFGGTTYLIVAHGWSPWWLLPTARPNAAPRKKPAASPMPWRPCTTF